MMMNSLNTMREWLVFPAVSCMVLLFMAWAALFSGVHAQGINQKTAQKTTQQPAQKLDPPRALHVDTNKVQVLVGTLRRIAESGSVRLTYRDDVLPFSFVPGNWRRPAGYSIDICTEVVAELMAYLGKPLKIQWVPVNAANRFEAIEQERADFECGTSSDTPQRRQHLAFSAPIFATGTRMLVRSDSPLRFLRDIVDKRVGLVGGTSATRAWNEWLDKQNGQIGTQTFSSYRQGLQMLAQKKVDALLGDEVLMYAYLTQTGKRRDYRFIGPWVSYEVYGIAFKKQDNEHLQVWLEGVLARMAASRQLHTLYTRWFERHLPGGENLRLPMNPVMQGVLAVLGRSAPAQNNGDGHTPAAKP